MVEKWAAAVVTLSSVAEWYPQTAYAGFTFCMQNEWQYVQQVVADTAPFFSPLEEVIRMHFLPALLGVPSVEIDGDYRQLLTHSVKLGGLAIRNPVDTAPRVHKASLAATRHLTVSLVDPATVGRGRGALPVAQRAEPRGEAAAVREVGGPGGPEEDGDVECGDGREARPPRQDGTGVVLGGGVVDELHAIHSVMLAPDGRAAGGV